MPDLRHRPQPLGLTAGRPRARLHPPPDRRRKTKEQIKAELVAEYGTEVLAEPPKSGFDLTAWLVPSAAILLAAVAIAFALRRWRRPRGPGRIAVERGGPPLDPADAERLDADLARIRPLKSMSPTKRDAVRLPPGRRPARCSCRGTASAARRAGIAGRRRAGQPWRGRGDDGADLSTAPDHARRFQRRPLHAGRAARLHLLGLGPRCCDRARQRAGVQLLPHPADRPVHDRRSAELRRPGVFLVAAAHRLDGRRRRPRASRRSRAPARGGRPGGGPARLLLGGADLQRRARLHRHRLAEALDLPSAAIELDRVEGDQRRLALPAGDRRGPRGNARRPHLHRPSRRWRACASECCRRSRRC